jgi:hypothetical protein
MTNVKDAKTEQAKLLHSSQKSRRGPAWSTARLMAEEMKIAFEEQNGISIEDYDKEDEDNSDMITIYYN